jgi:hypothetical protein
MRGTRLRRLQWGATVALAAVALASCSSGPSKPGPAPPAHHPKAAGGTTTSSTATTAATTPSTAAPQPTSGPLQAGAAVELPFSAGAVTATESTDGAVFAAPQDPTSPSTTVAWVVDPTGPAEIAEHVPTGVAALAADSNNLYVATYSNVLSYSRASGNQDSQWNLPPVHVANSSDDDLVAMTAADGDVFVSITQGDTVRVYGINPGSPAGPRLLVTGLGDVVGSDGSVYYESTAHHLSVRRTDGTTTTGPALADAPTQLGGGVQYVDAVAGGTVWVDEPAGQGLDATYTTYDASTLAKVGSFSGSVTTTVVDTSAGALALEPSGGATCPPPAANAPSSCVYRIDPQGAVADPLGVGPAVLLLGPGPAVVASDTSTNQFALIRLSGTSG